MNQDVAQSNWKEIKSEIRRVWGNIAHDDLEKTNGNFLSISGLIQEKYGQKKEEVTEKLKEIIEHFGQSTEDIKRNIAQPEKENLL